MEPELPEWLDAAFLATALQGGELQPPLVTVKGFHASPAVAAGNNYMSRLYRVKVRYIVEDEEKSTSLIIKTPFTRGVMNELGDEYNFYEKEPKVYNQLLPVLCSKINCDIGPKLLYSSVPNVLVLSDLKELGYEMCDRQKQLDFPHCVQVLKTIAKFHAASVLCKRDHPHLIELFKKDTIYDETTKMGRDMKPWIQTNMRTVAAIVDEMGLGKTLVDFILNRIESAPDSMVRLCKPKGSGLNVLNHGDLWISNILFKHSGSGDIVDVKFVDFQIVRYAMPVLDLIYLIWTSAAEDVRESRLPELCESYRLTLNSTLERLGCVERLTTEELHEDFRGAVDWAVVTLCSFLPVVVSEPDNVLDLEEVNKEDVEGGQQCEGFLRLFKGRRFRELLPKMLQQLIAWESTFK